MATKAVKGTEIVESGALDQHITQVKQLIGLYDQLDAELVKTAKSSKENAKNYSATKNADLKLAIADEKALTVAIEQQGKRKEARIKTEKLEITLLQQKQLLIEKEEKAIQAKINTESKALTLQNKKAAANKREIKEQEQLKSAYVQQTKTLALLNKQYSELAARGRASGKVARGILAEQQKVRAAYESTKKTLGQNYVEVGRYENALKGLKGTANNMIGTFQKLGLAIGSAMVVRDAFSTLVSYDEKLADISKTTGLTVEESDKLSKSLLTIDTRTSVENLQELAVAAGRLGIKGIEDIASFAEVADRVFVALGDDLGGTADEIATSLGKIADNFGASSQYGLSAAIEMTGSALNELSANSKANAGDILDFTNRLSGVGAQAGLTIPQVQALGALFSDTGQSIEVASSTLNILLPKLAENQAEFAKVAGLTADEFANLLKNNPLEALTAVAKGAKSSEGGLIGLNETLENFGVDSARAASIVGILAGETDKLNEFVTIGTDAYLENTSAMTEFNIKNQTTGALLEKLKKEWDKQVLGIGATTTASNLLKGTLGFLINNLGTIVKLVTTAGTAWLTYKTTLLAINVAEKANVAITAIRTNGLKSLFVSQTAANTATIAGTTATKGLNTAMKANPIGLLITGLVTAVSLLWQFTDATDENTEAQRLNNDELERGNELLQIRNKDFKSIEDQLKIVDDLNKTQLSSLKSQIEAQIEQTNAAEKSIKVANNQIKAYDDVKDSMEAMTSTQQKITDLQTKLNAKDSTGSFIVSGGNRDVLKKQLEAQKAALKYLKDGQKEYQSTTLQKSGLDITANETENLKKLGEQLDLVNDKIKNFKGEGSSGGDGGGGSPALTGLAKLQKELADLEKLRSDLFVKNKGVADEQFITYTLEAEALQEQIELLERRLKLSSQFFDKETIAENKIQKGTSRSAQISGESGTVGTTGKTNEEYAAEYQKFLDDKAAKELKDKEDLASATKAISQNLTDLVLAQTNKRIEAIDKEAEAQRALYEQSIQEQQNIINMRGVKDAELSKSLAFEKQAQAEALKAQEKLAKKKARIELFNSGLTLLNSEIQNGGSVGSTIGGISELISFLNGVTPAFWSGTDTTVGDALGIKYSSGRDGVMARLDTSEMVLNKEKVNTLSKYGINSTDEVVQAVKMGSMFASPSATVARPIMVNNSELVKELQTNNALLQQIASKPNSQFTIDELGKVVSITEKVTAGRKVTSTTMIKRLGR